MSKVRTFVILGLLEGSMVFVAGCCGFDPCDPLPNPCDSGCASPCGTAAPAPAPAPAAGKSCGGGAGCGGGKSCG